ncbi:MAG: hypothetical protein ACYC91_05455 [Solirubrobacteraceae bacterium]
MPEDTVLWAATRMRPVLEGRVPDEIRLPGPLRGSPGRERWPAWLAGHAMPAGRSSSSMDPCSS